ncbi:hypothetical protein AX14_006953 [Amanita brunnescens Koide BX004]|nr:hypothetical protein AX14_006953 [Amanita brunnescens Koide BX004]
MKFFSTATVLRFLVTISLMSNVAVAVPVESSSARLVQRQGLVDAGVDAPIDVD